VAWPQQQKGIVPKGNVANVANLANDLAAFEPVAEEQKILHRETYDRFNELVERRRSRLLGVTAGLSVINIAVTWCFHVPNRKHAHLDDRLDVLVARADDLPPLGNGSSVFRTDIGVYATFSAYLR